MAKDEKVQAAVVESGKALAGVVTMGSLRRLKEVFITTGMPV